MRRSRRLAISTSRASRSCRPDGTCPPAAHTAAWRRPPAHPSVLAFDPPQSLFHFCFPKAVVGEAVKAEPSTERPVPVRRIARPLARPLAAGLSSSSPTSASSRSPARRIARRAPAAARGARRIRARQAACPVNLVGDQRRRPRSRRLSRAFRGRRFRVSCAPLPAELAGDVRAGQPDSRGGRRCGSPAPRRRVPCRAISWSGLAFVGVQRVPSRFLPFVLACQAQVAGDLHALRHPPLHRR